MQPFTAITGRRRTAGLTLLEVAVATAILATVIAATLQTLLLSRHACLIGAVETDLDAKATAVLDMIADDLKDSGASMVTISPEQDMIEFQKNTDYVSSAIVWGPVMRYEVETIDGVNYLEKTIGADTSLIAEGVPDGGLTFTLDVNTVTVSLTRERTYFDTQQGEEQTYSVTRVTTVMMLNE